jgi:hypothetical protein
LAEPTLRAKRPDFVGKVVRLRLHRGACGAGEWALVALVFCFRWPELVVAFVVQDVLYDRARLSDSQAG